MIKVVPLGAGQDVGRSCVLVTVGSRNIMFDCGMHMGFQDARRFPDFSYISNGNYDDVIDCVIITHFHLDHCGALPHFTEQCGYNGPLVMTHPTRAICPILLEDFRKIAVERRGEQNFFTSENIRACMEKVTSVNIQETIIVDEDIHITAYYAGHVLGAAMFHVRVGEHSVIYTGDYNMTPDRHLGSARIVPNLRPDLLITETTYATKIRDSKRERERNFLQRIHSTVAAGGKVLIPVFALGRAQELCILVEAYWERMNLDVPVYFSAGLAAKANDYYRLYLSWTNQKIKSSYVTRNMFDFKHIKPFEMAFAENPGPQVLFATPGMLHAGTSLNVFKLWAPNPINTVIIPGYCVVGTVGNKLMTGEGAKAKGEQRIDIDRHTSIVVRCRVENLSFSAHADASGIEQLIRQVKPRNVMLVHGEKSRMQVISELGLPCFDPPNGTCVTIKCQKQPRVRVDADLLADGTNHVEGVIMFKPGDQEMRMVPPELAEHAMGLPQNAISYSAILQNSSLEWVISCLFPEDGDLVEVGTLELHIGSLVIIQHDETSEVELRWHGSSESLATRIVETYNNL